MKKIIIPQVSETAKYFCDRHPDRECFNEVTTLCWYGSKFDNLNLEMHLCDECMTEFYKFVELRFDTKPREREI